MGTMITCHGYINGYNNPVYNVHKNMGARYKWQSMVSTTEQDRKRALWCQRQKNGHMIRKSETDSLMAEF